MDKTSERLLAELKIALDDIKKLKHSPRMNA